MRKKEVLAIIMVMCLIQPFFLGNISSNTVLSIDEGTPYLMEHMVHNKDKDTNYPSASRPPSKDGKYLVTFESQSEKRSFLRNPPSDVKVLHEYSLLPLVLVQTTNEALKTIEEARSSILSATPNRKIPLPTFPSSGRKEEEVRPLSETSMSAIGAETLWDQGYKGEGTRVAIVDTGVYHHEEFENRIVSEKSFVKTEYGYEQDLNATENLFFHGTAVAGVACGAGMDPMGQGVAPEASIISGRVFPRNGGATSAGLIAAIEWAIQENADVINLSLGTSAPIWYTDPQVMAVNEAMRNGVTIVAAAGNAGNNGLSSMSVGSPGCAKNVITVGAVNYENEGPIHSYSSFGPGIYANVKPDVSAPSGVYSTDIPTYTRDRVYGTSFSSPHVAGAAALLTEYLKEADKTDEIPGTIKTTLMKTANSVTGYGKKYGDIYAGTGSINLAKAYDLLSRSGTPRMFDVTPSQVPMGIKAAHNAFYPYADKLFQNERLIFNFTIASSYATMMEVSYSGNITSALEIQSPNSFKVTPPTTLWEFRTKVKNVEEAYYRGTITFQAGSVTHNVPIEFQLRDPRIRILWDMKHTSWMRDFPFGQYRYTYYRLSELNVSVDLWHYHSDRAAEEVLDPEKYDLVFVPDAASYYPRWGEGGTAKGERALRFTRKEISAFKEYVHEGGYLSLIALGQEYNNFFSLNALARHFGLEFTGEVQPNSLASASLTSIIRGHLIARDLKEIPYVGCNINVHNPLTLPIATYGGDPVMTFSQTAGGGVFAAATNFIFDNARLTASQYRATLENLITNLVDLADHGDTLIQEMTVTPRSASFGEDVTLHMNVTQNVSKVSGMAGHSFGRDAFSMNQELTGTYSGAFSLEEVGGEVWLGANLTLPDGWILGYSEESAIVHSGINPPQISGTVTTPNYSNGSIKSWNNESMDMEFYISDDKSLNYTGDHRKLIRAHMEGVTLPTEIQNVNDTTWSVEVTLSEALISSLMDYNAVLDVRLTAFDLDGNKGQGRIKVSFDTTAPSVVITSPASGTSFNLPPVEVEWRGGDELSGLSHYEVQVDSGAWKNVGMSTTFTFEDLSFGKHTIRVKAIDVGGSQKVASITISIRFGPLIFIAIGAVVAVLLAGIYYYMKRRSD